MPPRSLVHAGLTIIGGMLLGWVVLAVTIDRLFANALPGVALFWNPGSADANTLWADRQLQDDIAAATSPEFRAHALRALQRQPIQPAAARLLSVSASGRGQEARAARLLAYAEAMSRRDLQTQLLLIQFNVDRGDVATALLHYDRAMRTSSASWAVLFPILDKAADLPGVGSRMAVFLARRPPWTRPFLEQYVPHSQSVSTLYAFARQLRLDRPASSDPAMLQLIEKRLVELAAFRPAALLYARAHGMPPVATVPLRNGAFEQPGGWDPFDWNLADDPDLSAIRQPSPAGGGMALFLTAGNGRGGDVAVQLLMLPAGRYRIGARVGDVGGDRLAFPQMILRCVSDGRELLHQVFPAAPDKGQRWAMDVVIPPNCPAEQLVLQARSPFDTQQTVPWIDDIAIHPEGRN